MKITHPFGKVKPMDPVTHTLSGAVWSRIGFSQKWGKTATLTLIGAATLPDIDHITLRLMGPLAYLRYHRGFTHSIIGGIIVALVFAGLVFSVFKDSRRMGYPRLIGLSLLGIYTHIFLDLITSYGTQLFFPFSNHRYSLDLIFIIDILFTLILFAPLILMRFYKEKSEIIASSALLAAAAYVLIAYVSQGLALSKGEAKIRDMGVDAIRMEALPLPFSPFRWSIIAEDKGRFYQINLDLLRESNSTEVFEKGPWGDDRVKKAEMLDMVKTYLWFARFPVVSLKEAGNGYVLEYYDIRFNISPTRKPFLLSLVIGRDGSLKSGELTFHTIGEDK